MIILSLKRSAGVNRLEEENWKLRMSITLIWQKGGCSGQCWRGIGEMRGHLTLCLKPMSIGMDELTVKKEDKLISFDHC